MTRLLEVHGLSVEFVGQDGGARQRVVEDVSFGLEREETLALVGESGSGKSVTCLALMRLLRTPPAFVHARRARFDGRDILALSRRELDRVRGAELCMVFQDPMAALHPLMAIGRQLEEVLETHRNATRREARRLSIAALEEVRIADPAARAESYPHELSGGMRQRVMIAMALLCRPKVLFADEPTTALDVTIQAEILELLTDLQARHGTAVVLVTHSLAVAAQVADRIAVMYAGRIVETAPAAALFEHPAHPYTQALLVSTPSLESDPDIALPTIRGQPPTPRERPPGCAFEPRCTIAVARCRAERPLLEPLRGRGLEALRARDTDEQEAACFAAGGDEGAR